MKKLIVLAILALLFYGTFVAQSAPFWPTPTSSPSPFVGVTPLPTPAPALSQLQICFQDNVAPIVCGQNLLISAGDVVATGLSNGPPVNGATQGPWPSTVILTVNGVKYSAVPVSQTNGLIGFATIPGVQALTISVQTVAPYLGAVQTVISH